MFDVRTLDALFEQERRPKFVNRRRPFESNHGIDRLPSLGTPAPVTTFNTEQALVLGNRANGVVTLKNHSKSAHREKDRRFPVSE
jgi:hypothetical protein